MEQTRQPPNKPIRVGIIGLSTKPSAWATLAHYPRLASSPNYQITALCNSSLESTNAAIKHFNLPSTTTAHSSYESLAADPNIDLYVVSTRADAHWECALPALQAGKDVYVEWPLAANVPEARKMVELAQQKGIKTIVGLQGRASRSVLKVKEIISSGRLGDVHSVDYQGWINIWQNNAASRRYNYFMDRKVGGNLLTIYGGHILDSIFFACGELRRDGTEKLLAGNLRKRMKIMEDDGTLTEEDYPKDTPDQIMLVGRLEPSSQEKVSPMFNFHLRAGAKFIDGPGSVWRIYGTKAELVMEFKSAGPQIGEATSIKISDFEKGVVEEVSIEDGGKEWTSISEQGRNIGRLYEAFAEGKHYGDWELALKRHELIEEFYNNME